MALTLATLSKLASWLPGVTAHECGVAGTRLDLPLNGALTAAFIMAIFSFQFLGFGCSPPSYHYHPAASIIIAFPLSLSQEVRGENRKRRRFSTLLACFPALPSRLPSTDGKRRDNVKRTAQVQSPSTDNHQSQDGSNSKIVKITAKQA